MEGRSVGPYHKQFWATLPSGTAPLTNGARTTLPQRDPRTPKPPSHGAAEDGGGEFDQYGGAAVICLRVLPAGKPVPTFPAACAGRILVTKSDRPLRPPSSNRIPRGKAAEAKVSRPRIAAPFCVIPAKAGTQAGLATRRSLSFRCQPSLARPRKEECSAQWPFILTATNRGPTPPATPPRASAIFPAAPAYLGETQYGDARQPQRRWPRWAEHDRPGANDRLVSSRSSLRGSIR